MDTLVKADIFFFITSIAVIVGTLALCVVAYYIVRALKEFERLSQVLEEHVEDTSGDVQTLVADFKESLLYKFLIRKRKNRK